MTLTYLRTTLSATIVNPSFFIVVVSKANPGAFSPVRRPLYLSGYAPNSAVDHVRNTEAVYGAWPTLMSRPSLQTLCIDLSKPEISLL